MPRFPTPEPQTQLADIALVVKAVTTSQGRACWYPPDAILTRAEVAEVLGVDERTVQRYPIRVAHCSQQVPRYLFRDVVAFLDARAA